MAITQTVWTREKIDGWYVETGEISMTTSTGNIRTHMMNPKHCDLASYTEAEAFRVQYSQTAVKLAMSNGTHYATYQVWGTP